MGELETESLSLSGAAVLGRVGGEMMITDPFVVNLINPSKFLQYGTEAFFAIGVLALGKLLMRRARRAEQAELATGDAHVATDPEKEA